jgi:menaquinone-dependent protoporphyrinogen oxidase
MRFTPSSIESPGRAKEKLVAAILILYSTVDGQTRRISERLQQCLTEQCSIEQDQHRVTLAVLHESPPELAGFDLIVLGASVRYGAYRRHVYQFVTEHAVQLARRPTAFFTVCAVARRLQQADPQHNRYVRAFLRRTGWQPSLQAVFAGRIEYPRYSCWDRWAIRLIMKLTRGPTDPHGVFEFTDWHQVEGFAQLIGQQGARRNYAMRSPGSVPFNGRDDL